MLSESDTVDVGLINIEDGERDKAMLRVDAQVHKNAGGT